MLLNDRKGKTVYILLKITVKINKTEKYYYFTIIVIKSHMGYLNLINKNVVLAASRKMTSSVIITNSIIIGTEYLQLICVALLMISGYISISSISLINLSMYTKFINTIPANNNNNPFFFYTILYMINKFICTIYSRLKVHLKGSQKVRERIPQLKNLIQQFRLINRS